MAFSATESSQPRNTVAIASIALAAVLIGAGLLLRRLTHHNHIPLFDSRHALGRAALGAAVGATLATLNAALVGRARVFSRVRRLAHHAVEGIEPRWHTMLVVALAAAFGEEIFFRGALDPVAGMWLTAVAFVAVHGALRIRDRNSLLFAVFLFAASVGLSALYRWRGLECALAAHAAYDLAMLAWLVRGAALSRGQH
jgi:membrane protease YdiL (CAAX protease family)